MRVNGSKVVHMKRLEGHDELVVELAFEGVDVELVDDLQTRGELQKGAEVLADGTDGFLVVGISSPEREAEVAFSERHHRAVDVVIMGEGAADHCEKQGFPEVLHVQAFLVLALDCEDPFAALLIGRGFPLGTDVGLEEHVVGTGEQVVQLRKVIVDTRGR